MRFSPFVERISGDGVAAWDIHNAAFEAQRCGEDVIILRDRLVSQGMVVAKFTGSRISRNRSGGLLDPN